MFFFGGYQKLSACDSYTGIFHVCITRCHGRAWKNFFNLAMKSFSRPAWRWSSLNACVTRCWGLDVGGLHKKKNTPKYVKVKKIFMNDIIHIESYMGFWWILSFLSSFHFNQPCLLQFPIFSLLRTAKGQQPKTRRRNAVKEEALMMHNEPRRSKEQIQGHLRVVLLGD